ncbi:alpha/beta hydrolase [Desulfopila sp. IMCC35008]|uniref:lipase family alpha/beta hydrolase n=1 Tax=Desulfopila sp. IMCC35008 TaxID=2653858 RepID=UPI00197AC1F9|nr:alpha/beta hydrolase [Desulfopila sp. IMCC35008]
MQRLEQALQNQGYHVVNIDYPSTEYGIEYLADMAVSNGISVCEEKGANVVHFVTHSLGGILTRYYLEKNRLDKLGRIVMLGPPNQGSEVTDALEDQLLYRYFFGPAGQQLGTDPDSFVNSLGPVSYPVGVIVGSEAAFFDRYFSDIIPGKDDGKVSVERAKVKGMSDFLILPYAHPYIMEEDEVISQTLHFLKHGSFLHQRDSDFAGSDNGEQ